jgi:prepilin-type N-terminal cleavage/methylation domain-containing protein/prepilin-type processing-associated H-X9-DG protein
MSIRPSAVARSAFTLIELLVVVAIVSLLAAILFPVFGRTRESGRKSSCLSNLKQIGLAFTQYTQDYDEAYPLTSFGATNISWTLGTAPYLKSTQVFRCSSDTSAAWNTPVAPPTNNHYTTSYLMNAWMAGTSIFTRQSAIQSTSQVVLLSESNGVARDHFHPFNWIADPDSPAGMGVPSGGPKAWTFDTSKNQTTEFPLTQHLEGFNLAYCDGHVKWTKWSMVWPPKAGGPLEGVFDPRQ